MNSSGYVGPDALVRAGEQRSPVFSGEKLCRAALGWAGETPAPTWPV